jgi:hypothetical protein
LKPYNSEYTQTAAALALLNEKYCGQLFEVTTTKGMEEAKKARAMEGAPWRMQ